MRQVEQISSSAVLDPETMITTVAVKVRVHAPLGALLPALDPENWASVARTAHAVGWAPAFRATDRVATDARGQPMVSRLGPGQYDVTKDLSVKATDGSWSGLLYEHVDIRVATIGLMQAHNLLRVEYQATSEAPTLKYSLHSCLETRWGVLRRRGGIDTDEGVTRMVPDGPGRTVVEAIKSVRYTPFSRMELGRLGPVLRGSRHGLNHLAPQLAGWWMEAMVMRCGSML